jgi:hypothetical protein
MTMTAKPNVRELYVSDGKGDLRFLAEGEQIPSGSALYGRGYNETLLRETIRPAPSCNPKTKLVLDTDMILDVDVETCYQDYDINNFYATQKLADEPRRPTSARTSQPSLRPARPQTARARLAQEPGTTQAFSAPFSHDDATIFWRNSNYPNMERENPPTMGRGSALTPTFYAPVPPRTLRPKPPPSQAAPASYLQYLEHTQAMMDAKAVCCVRAHYLRRHAHTRTRTTRIRA